MNTPSMTDAPIVKIDGNDLSNSDVWSSIFGTSIPTFEIGQTVSVEAIGKVPDGLWDYLANVGAGAVIGAAAGSIVPGLGTAIGAAIGGTIGAVSVYVDSHNWRVIVTDSFDGTLVSILDEKSGEPERVFKTTYAFPQIGEHKINGTLSVGLIARNYSNEWKVNVIPIPVYFPVTSDRCIIISPSTEPRIISGEVRHKRTGQLLGEPGLDVKDLIVIPFPEDDYKKAEKNGFIPYNPKTGSPDVNAGFYGGIFDATNTNGLWSFTDNFWVNKAAGISVIPSKKVSYVTPKDERQPDVKKRKYGRFFVPPTEKEKVVRIFLPENTSAHDIHIGETPESWPVLVPFIIGGQILEINDKMKSCTEGIPADKIEIELLEDDKVYGKTTSAQDGSFSFTYSSITSGKRKLQFRAKVPASTGFSEETYSEPRFVYLYGASDITNFIFSPIGLILVGGVIIGGTALYFATKE